MTATGEVIAEFDGVIDIESSEGGKVLFDYEGKANKNKSAVVIF